VGFDVRFDIGFGEHYHTTHLAKGNAPLLN
jgi:hypothetical protein